MIEKNPDWINTYGVDPEFTQQPEFWELTSTDENLKNQANIDYICPDCRNNKVLCQICKMKGNFFKFIR